ncbi:MAG: entericidin A/B family lipoprotein [Phycisphaeraceae bacterium]|nr:entericidin A/B family lipoprotein [Phycisphaerales bacterium]QOJ17228.1 MAG: entericidin A/B family lipoprotein [Phycisphaeraceae bacterium]
MRDQNFRIIIGTAALALMLAALTGCNTIEGAGRDLKAVGEGISEAASDLNPSQ